MKKTDPRHGDCSLWLVDGLPEGAKRLDNKACKCATFDVCAKHGALAHGEVSGHTHLLERPLPLYEVDGFDDEGRPEKQVYLHNDTDQHIAIAQTDNQQMQVDLEHLERCYGSSDLHAPIKDVIAPGQCFKVVFPREYDWATGEIQRARD